MMTSVPCPTTTFSALTPLAFASTCLRSKKLCSGYCQRLCSSPPIASSALGDGPQAFSLEASLTTSVSPSSRWTCSVV